MTVARAARREYEDWSLKVEAIPTTHHTFTVHTYFTLLLTLLLALSWFALLAVRPARRGRGWGACGGAWGTVTGSPFGLAQCARRWVRGALSK